MRLNLSDPQSIADWRNVAPERHDAFLRWVWKNWRAFRWAIEASRELIR